MNDYGKIITSYSDGKIISLDYYINGRKFCIIDTGQFQYITTKFKKFDVAYTPYKTIKDNGLKDYLLKIIEEYCTIYQPNSLIISASYRLPQQPFFDALITKIKKEWIDTDT